MLPLVLLASAPLIVAQSPVKDWNQCYYAKDSPAHPSLVPCLTENDDGSRSQGKDYASSWCCFAGDNCISQACWDNTTGVTYQYGCNDPTYEHNNCPPKGGLDMGKSPWVGLVRCNDTHNEGFEKFWACNHPDTCGDFCPVESNKPQVTQTVWPDTIQNLPPLGFCTDLGSRVLAMYARETLNSTGGVPMTVNTSGKPKPTYPSPQSSGAGQTSVTRTQTAPDMGSTATSTSTPTAEPEAAAALSGGAIAGIAVGSTLGVVAVLAGFFFMWRRRRAKQQQDAAAAAAPAAPYVAPGGGAAELAPPDEKRNLMQPNTPSTVSDGMGIQRPVSDMSMSTVVSSPSGTPRTPNSPYYPQGHYHAELPDDPRVIHEMPAINERSEMP
ncbi:hypothetical protein COL154_010458 [Colletotrichum chrysophilum]|uniref:LPXTG-domain-containing protein n=1 Tax=Colletotrichum noveboracense TaxID=2664923 RepID=A0A9W4WFC5_9PEZI|nr:uncharacterized protein COL26b_013507 [Colletotrichum chrysophilum]KAH9232983.1 hypothetical protein K456DRAFT_53706 [Colletotrichum gloeosporioides 23]KAJ0269047.1 hypothetical protein COL940_012803 [Colletotrichum noveboracense]KAJ0273500.1 hypothetical protein CBS470a_012227 [Colletotrichum nupharicola]KAJ0297861.1 hypothetical protein Brms1b_013524 [Colletotrichum noveboracense]KAJ0340143.1 hypothetical protein KNSL1_011696 [Colletotrichum chrysophilum]